MRTGGRGQAGPGRPDGRRRVAADWEAADWAGRARKGQHGLWPTDRAVQARACTACWSVQNAVKLWSTAGAAGQTHHDVVQLDCLVVIGFHPAVRGRPVHTARGAEPCEGGQRGANQCRRRGSDGVEGPGYRR